MFEKLPKITSLPHACGKPFYYLLQNSWYVGLHIMKGALKMLDGKMTDMKLTD